MAKPELEFHHPEAPWRPAGAPGFWEKILAVDAESGAYTRLARLDPGTDTSDMGVLVHDFREEVYIVEGDLTDLTLGETFTAGMYACRPVGMRHGPYRTKGGVTMVEMRSGMVE